MTRWWRWTLALLLCAVTAVLGPLPAATAADAGVGRVVADLGPVPNAITQPGFSFDGAYFAYLASGGDRCDLHLYDLRAHQAVSLSHARVVCDGLLVHWAAHADTLVWQVNAAGGDITAYVWDADPEQVSVLAPDAHVFGVSGVSAEGRFLAFTGRSDTHPAPSVDAPRYAGYVYDRASGVSLTLSRSDLHVQFVGWSPKGENFVAETGGRTSYDHKTGSCFGAGTACRDFTDRYVDFGIQWSRDGTAVISSGAATGVVVYDFSDGSSAGFPTRAGYVDYAQFLGSDADRLMGYVNAGAVVWNHKTGEVSTIPTPDGPADPSPNGKYLLFRDAQKEAYRYLNVSTGAAALATYRGVSKTSTLPGYWTEDGSFYLGVGPGGCSSLRQWSPATNTVSLFGPPPGARSCYALPNSLAPEPRSSASGRFALAQVTRSDGTGLRDYVADLRRHVLMGPLNGGASRFAPAGGDVLPVSSRLDDGSVRLLLVDPTPVPDVDDKPRWSAATPANGVRVEAGVGAEVHVQLGASDLQQTPVNLYFRWRTTAGVPVASAPQGWSCERRRLAGGATVSDCTFAPPQDHTAVRFLDVWAVNYVTGAQSDTRSYRVETR